MIEQQGKVVAVAAGSATVRLGGSSGCSACDAGRGCGAGIFGRLLKRRPLELELDNRVNAEHGQPVIVGIPESVFLKMITRMYLLPLLAGVAGAAFGHYLCVVNQLTQGLSDITVLLFALICGTAAVLWSRKRSGEFPGRTIVHLLRVVESPEYEK